jgi:acetyltransferase-like isoleucine patch superfamily enzyme
MKGYKIGKGVTIAFGAVVSGEEVSIGDHTSIGLFTIIRGKKIVIGPHVTIGSTTFLDTPFLEIGEESKINEQVFIGGLQDPDSKFVLGKNCQILQLCYINPAKYISIGDNSAIGGNSLIFGHASWLSEFDGYPVTFAPIELGNNVSVSWKVFILPGVKIGDGALIGANSLVNKDIPPRCLASGFPARVISREPVFPKVPTRNDKILFLENIIREMMLYLQKSGLEFNLINDNDYSITFRCKKLFRTIQTTWKMRVVYHEEQLTNMGEINDVDVLISLPELSEEWRRKLIRRRVAWIDIEKRERADIDTMFSEEVVQYLRRYGLRFLRWGGGKK